MKRNTEALDFLVVNTRSNNVAAAFMIPRDALHYIKWRRQSEGPHGPTYEIENADGSMVSPTLDAQVRAAQCVGNEEWARAQPGWPDKIGAQS